MSGSQPSYSGTRQVPARILAGIAGEVLERDGSVVFEVRGRSMLPTLRSGDLVEVSFVEPADLRPGCLVAVRAGSGLAVHRFIRRTTGGLILTAGDAVNYRDLPTPEAELLGKVTEVERDNRRFVPRSGRLAVWRWELRRVPARLAHRFRFILLGR
jgi:signal peptidase I